MFYMITILSYLPISISHVFDIIKLGVVQRESDCKFEIFVAALRLQGLIYQEECIYI
jgi:hypothetical protein